MTVDHTGDTLSGVSCVSRTDGTAVGYIYSSALKEQLLLGERWNGQRWSVQRIPSPTVSVLNAVSCSSKVACTAVGDYFGPDTGGTGVTLAEHWNGAKWSIQSTPSPAGLDSSLAGVSCASATSCTAVGGFDNNSRTGGGTVVERWNGAKWSVMRTPPPAGVKGRELAGVACTSTAACIAAGQSTTHRSIPGTKLPISTLAERSKQAHWTMQRIPNPAGGGDLQAVGCSSGTACQAVGTINCACSGPSRAAGWNGKKWTTEPTPSTAGELSAVSCTSAEACTAVGAGPLAERWNGHNWSIQPTPNPGLP